MARKSRIDLRLASRVLLVQLAVVTLTLIVAFGLFAQFNRHSLDLQTHVHALDIARVVASSPTVVDNIARYNDGPLTATPALVDELAAGPLQSVAARVQQRTHVLFVVIANKWGIRLAHPDRAKLALRVSTNPGQALAGRELVVRQSSTLGPSIVAKVPVLEPGSNLVLGLVSVGISTKESDEQFSANLRLLAALGGVVLLIGVAGAVALARRWRAMTLGLRPGVREEEAQWVKQS